MAATMTTAEARGARLSDMLGEEPEASAKLAGLRYVSDLQPGIRRLRTGGGFRYLAPEGTPIRDPKQLSRIRSLAVPPAWTDVWICAHPNGHIQATGRDARGRKQYRYHKRWREVRDEAKYARLINFGEALPAIRRAVTSDLALPGLPRAKVLAAVIAILDATALRIGNQEYARANQSFGLTTMREDHTEVLGSLIRFSFRGKSGKDHRVQLHDRRLARVVKRCQDLPGQELFRYVGDDDRLYPIDSDDVNEYLEQAGGLDFTAKEFRTWWGTVLAASALKSVGSFDSEAEAKRKISQAIESVARELGNTPTVCRTCYVHPAVIDAYHQGRLEENPPRQVAGLQDGEAAVLALLRRQLAREAGDHQLSA